jgi:uncharacterized protein (TIGR03435 family)
MKSWIPVLLSCGAAVAQQPAEKIAFEVASIKTAQPSPMGQIRVQMGSDNGMLRYTNVSLKDCIRTAFRVKDFQVDGPEWLDSARFDIAAKLPAGSTKAQVPEMLQSLLEERFHLALHRETKDHAVYALVAARSGAKLTPSEIPSDDSGAPAARGGPRGGQMQTMQVDPVGVHLKASGTTLAGLAEMISRFCERPVVDMTNIQGLYDFDLVFSPEAMRGGMRVMGGPMPPPGGGDRAPADAASEGAAIYTSVEKYGLKLESRKAPMEILIIDRIDKTPTEN